MAMADGVRADINPWIASDIYDAKKWDSAGPQTATPWLHAPTWQPGQEWGVLSGRYRDATALTGSWGGARDRLVEKGVSLIGFSIDFDFRSVLPCTGSEAVLGTAFNGLSRPDHAFQRML